MEDTNKDEKNKQEISKPKIVLLSGFALTILFLFAFGCYGCSYQPISPPNTEQAIDVVTRLRNSSWVLDETDGTPALEELYDLALITIAFSAQSQDDQCLAMELGFARMPAMYGQLVYEEESGFTFSLGQDIMPITVVYSLSRDGKSETLTLVGQESNKHCYYLKL
ncbi:MAG: hypothetical protein EOM15_05555 [Spirochaetia bacterium]|nr:hypothetical protein [Spirochaetia bacterium]